MPDKKKWSIKRFFQLLWTLYPAITCHHPYCEDFRNDYYKIGPVKLCIGCFTAYPLALAMVITHFIIGEQFGIPWWGYMIFGTLFGLFELFSLAGWTKKKAAKIIVKANMGFGIGLFVIGIIETPIHVALRWLIFLLGIYYASALGSLRLRNIEKHCRGCPEYDGWHHCSGWKLLREKIDKHGFDIK